MLKEFIEHIQNTTQPQIREVEGATFAITADGVAKEILPTIFHPDPLPLNSLDAMVKLVRTEASNMDTPLYITIPDHMTVRCFGQPDVEARYFRQVYYEARATDVPGWNEKVTLGFEEAQIALRTRFQETQDTLYAMKLVSDISLGAKVIFNDNGIATTITTQKGVALQTNAYLWVLLDKLAAALGQTKEELYRGFIREIGVFRDFHLAPEEAATFEVAWSRLGTGWVTEQVDYTRDGEQVVIRAYYGSSQYNTKQMTRLIRSVAEECKAQGIETMTPEELAGLMDRWEAG